MPLPCEGSTPEQTLVALGTHVWPRVKSTLEVQEFESRCPARPLKRISPKSNASTTSGGLANTNLDIPAQRAAFASGDKLLQYNLNGHTYWVGR